VKSGLTGHLAGGAESDIPALTRRVVYLWGEDIGTVVVAAPAVLIARIEAPLVTEVVVDHAAAIIIEPVALIVRELASSEGITVAKP
jgi:hypothetical protein